MKIVILDGVPLNPGDLDWTPIKKLGEVTIYDRSPVDTVAERIKDAEIVLTNKAKVFSEHIEAAPNLKYIGEMATGFDNIDAKAARARDIPVCNVPGYSSNFTAQTAIALLMELTHRAGLHADTVRSGRWSSSPDFSFWEAPLTELDGKNMLIVGLGTIGGRVAQIAEAMGMTVIAASLPGRPPSSEKARLPLDEAIPQADVISLHCPLTAETRGLINADRLNLFKPTAFLVNTARGAIVDEAALAQALREGKLAGFAGDVLSQEPPAADNPLLSAPNCLITPHLGWASPEARQRCLLAVAANISAFIDGGPTNVVN